MLMLGNRDHMALSHNWTPGKTIRTRRELQRIQKKSDIKKVFIRERETEVSNSILVLYCHYFLQLEHKTLWLYDLVMKRWGSAIYLCTEDVYKCVGMDVWSLYNVNLCSLSSSRMRSYYVLQAICLTATYDFVWYNNL